MEISNLELKRVLQEQRRAFESKPKGIEREVLAGLAGKAKLPHIVAITGVRRSGKSTLLRQIADRYCNDGYYYVTFEDERLKGFDPREFNRIYGALLELFGERRTFLIDEIQEVAGFESFVRRLYEEGFKFYITGSNSRLLGSELASKLTGRHVDVSVEPFSFREFLSARGFVFDSKMLLDTRSVARIKTLFGEYLSGGGMPEFVVYGDPETLMRTYEDIVTKDIIIKERVKNSAQLRELYRYMLSNFSKKFSFNSLNSLVRLGSVNTVQKYVELMERAYLGKVIRKFDYSIKKQMVNDRKLYPADSGFVKVVSAKIAEGRGWFLESLVFNRLKRSGEVFYYKGKSECDFVVSSGGAVSSAVQVCYELNVDNRKRESDGLAEAMDALNLKEGLILTYDQEEEHKEGPKKITVLPVWKWLLLWTEKPGGTQSP